MVLLILFISSSCCFLIKEAFKTPTLLHCAAINAHANVIQWLKQKSFPPIAKCRRLFDLQENVSLYEFLIIMDEYGVYI